MTFEASRRLLRQEALMRQSPSSRLCLTEPFCPTERNLAQRTLSATEKPRPVKGGASVCKQRGLGQRVVLDIRRSLLRVCCWPRCWVGRRRVVLVIRRLRALL